MCVCMCVCILYSYSFSNDGETDRFIHTSNTLIQLMYICMCIHINNALSLLMWDRAGNIYNNPLSDRSIHTSNERILSPICQTQRKLTRLLPFAETHSLKHI